MKHEEYARGFDYYRERYFAECRGEAARGEASTSYICHDWVAERIKNDLPQVKLIAVLRNPVERAFSGYWHTVKSGMENLSFAAAIRGEPERLSALTDPVLKELRPFGYMERGFYFEQITSYLKYFTPRQMHLILFDDLVAAPEAVMSEVFRFLDVPPHRLGPAPASALNRSTPAEQALSAEMRRFLVEVFEKDVGRLAGLLNRNLDHWLALDE